MPSKCFAWEYKKNQQDYSHSGIFGLSFPDIFCERLILDAIPRTIQQGNLHILHASELTSAWIENTFNTVDFFSSNDSYLVLESQSLSSQVINFLKENPLSVEGRVLIFSFNKTSKIFDQLEKATKGSFTKIDPPKFWESAKYLDFFCDSLNVKLTSQIKNYILNAIENDGLHFFNAVNLLKLHAGEEGNLSLEQARELIEVSKVDQFELADTFCSKKFKRFFEKLLGLGEDYESLRGIFTFMQSHLFKVLDPSYASKKARLSKYDQEIQKLSRVWNQDDLVRALRMFSELEVLAKSKNQALLNELKMKYFRSPR